MFYSDQGNGMSNPISRSLDFVVDFATLGEYRVIGDQITDDNAEDRLWSSDVEWQPAPRSREVECHLPRLHNRASMMSRELARVRG
jgi:hypothetical protein